MQYPTTYQLGLSTSEKQTLLSPLLYNEQPGTSSQFHTTNHVQPLDLSHPRALLVSSSRKHINQDLLELLEQEQERFTDPLAYPTSPASSFDSVVAFVLSFAAKVHLYSQFKPHVPYSQSWAFQDLCIHKPSSCLSYTYN